MKIRLIDLVSPRRWRSVFIAILKWVLFKMGEEPQPEVHKIEQYMYRYLACYPCLCLGQCLHCGCKIPERMHVQTDSCSAGHWGKFKNAYDWEEYKTKHNVKFKLEEDEHPS